ncbi:ABC transporter permease [Microbacterium aureliae]
MSRSPFQRVFHRKMTPMEATLLAIIVGYTVIVALRSPTFFTAATAFDLVRSGSAIMILALGVLVVFISGGIDVSFAAVAIVSGYSAVLLSRALGIDNLILIIAFAVIIGSALGAINALLIHFYELPTLIVTLGTASVFHGAMALLLGMKTFTRTDVPTSMLDFGSARLVTFQVGGSQAGLTVFIIVVAAACLLTWFLLYRTRIGRSVYALGSNAESASRTGMSLLKIQLFVYMYVGALAGLAGIVYFSNLAYINPAALIGTELAVIAAVVIGGAKLTGGEGTILGTVLGVILWQLFQSTLIHLGLDSSYNGLFFGAVLVLILAFIYSRQRKANKQALVFTAS